MNYRHHYPLRDHSDEGQRRFMLDWDKAARTQRFELAVAPRCRHISPLFKIVDAGGEVGINDFVGGDFAPLALLEQAVAQGVVIVRGDRPLADLTPARLTPSLTVSNAKVVVVPEGGFHANPWIHWQGLSLKRAWDAHEAACRAARAPFVVTPNAAIPLRDGSFLHAGDEISLANFRHPAPGNLLPELVRLRLVIRDGESRLPPQQRLGLGA